MRDNFKYLCQKYSSKTQPWLTKNRFSFLYHNYSGKDIITEMIQGGERSDCVAGIFSCYKTLCGFVLPQKNKNPQKATLLIGSPTSSSFGSCLAMLSSKETVGFLAVSRMSCTSLSPRSSRPLARIPTLITPFSIRAELSVLPRKIKMKTSRAEIRAQRTQGGFTLLLHAGEESKMETLPEFLLLLA